jgi:hypothetical protein
MTLTIVGAPVNGALLDLPWDVPLEEWPADQLIGLPAGVSRHVVRFVRVEGTVYAVKEIGTWSAQREYRLLQQMQRSHVPVRADRRRHRRPGGARRAGSRRCWSPST